MGKKSGFRNNSPTNTISGIVAKDSISMINYLTDYKMSFKTVRKLSGLFARPNLNLLVAWVSLLMGGLLFSPDLSGQTKQKFSTAGSGTTSAIPAGIKSITVQTWGGGGAGGGSNTNKYSGGGGGGGGYTLNNAVAVSPGTSYNYTVGTGGLGSSGASGGAGGASSFNSTAVANGGGGGGVGNNPAGTGGTGGTGTGGTYFTGGNGGAGGTSPSGSMGGGGGSSAGSSANGNAGTAGNSVTTPGAAGSAVTDGGAGVAGAAINTNGTAPGPTNVPGGGGSGSGDKTGGGLDMTGGAGANGQIIISYFVLSGTSSAATCPEQSATVTLTGSPTDLPVGTYTVTYDLGAPNASTGNVATMNVTSAGSGTFQTRNLTNGGTTLLTITHLSSGIYGTGYENTGANNTVNITVSASVGGTASSGQTICYGSSPANITLSGNTGAIQWQYSTDNFSSSIVDITGAASATLTSAQMGTLTASRYYRAKVTSGTCDPAYSNVLSVNVNTAVTAGETTGNQTIAYNATPSSLTSSEGGTGAGTITYEWQADPGNGYATISEATAATYAPGALTTTTSYKRRTVSSNASPTLTCYSAYTTPVTVTVISPVLHHFIITTIESPQTAGTAIPNLTITAKDSEGNTVTGFTGKVTFGGTAGITGTSGDFTAGQLTGVSVTPTVAGTGLTLIVTDTGSGKTGTSTFNVNPGALDHFAISAIASPQNVGTPITGIALTAQDFYNNTVTSYTGTGTFSGTAGITGTTAAFTAGQLTGVSVTPSLAGSSITLILTGSDKTGTSSFDVNYPAPAISSITPATKCAGGADFILTVNGSGFVPSTVIKIGGSSRTTTYINSGQITAAITSSDISTSGSPAITVFNPTPGGGTSSGAVLTVSQVSVTPAVTQPTCYSNGNITLEASGGTSPYNYDWADISGTNNVKDRTGLPAGTYSVTVTDAIGCTVATVSRTLTAAAGCTGISVCKSDASSALSVTPDQDNDTYTWAIESFASPGTFYNDKIISGAGTPSIRVNWTTVPVGAYNVSVIASNASCGVSAPSYMVVYVTEPTVVATADAVCEGGNLKLYASGGVSYVWTGPGGYASQSANPLIYNASAALNDGTYTVTVTDANGCTKSADVLVAVQAGPTLSSNAITMASCGNSTGAISINTNGTSFLWSNGATTQNISSISSGNYTVTTTNSAGCSVSDTYSVQNSDGPSSSIASTTNVSCYGGSNGTINLTIAQGEAPYIVSWTANNGGIVPSGHAADQNLTGLTAGTYYADITDKNLCHTTAFAIITQPNELLLDAKVTNVSCFGNSTGIIEVTASGGAGSYSYKIGSGIYSSAYKFQNLAAGSYTITVKDANGCEKSFDYAISQPSAALSAVPATKNVSCYGESNGQVTLNVTGGTAPYAYTWTASGGGVVPSGQSNYQNLSGLVAGTYSVTITDAKGCSFVLSGSSAITVSQPLALSLITSLTNVSCNGGSNGAVDLTVSGGTSTYTYSWSNGSVSQDLTGLTSGTYTVTVTDFNGCQASSAATVSQPAVLSGSTVVTAVSCNGGTTGGINLSVSGGTSGFSYLWSNTENTEDLTNIAAGLYHVTITDSKGCTSTVSATVGEPALITVSGAVTNVLCNGNSTGAINIAATGGTGTLTYDWGSGITTEDRTGLKAGTYSVTVSDGNGCTATASYTITQTSTVSLSATSSDITCYGNSDGSINLSVTGGALPYAYAWTGPGDFNSTSEDLSALSDGTYSVTVTDHNGCSATTSKTISRPSVFTLSAIPADASCNGRSNGSVDLTVSGSNPDYTFLWSNGATTQDLASVTAGAYNVTITDIKGCTATVSATVGQPAATSVSSAITDVKCYGGSSGAIDITVTGGTPAYSFVWKNSGSGTISTSEDVTGLSVGTYTLEINDARGCTQSATFTVGTAPALTVGVSTVDRNCLSANGSAQSSVSGGTGPYNYLWSPGGATTSGISGLNTGTYTVTVTDANLCTAISSGTVGSLLCIAPVAVNDSYTTAFDAQIVNGTVASNDHDEIYPVLSYTLQNNPPAEAGALVWDASNNGSFTFTPKPGYVGSFSVTYMVTNPVGMYSEATLTITVAALPTQATNSSKSICITAGSVVLSGNIPVVGTGSWSVIMGPGTSSTQFSGISDPTATFTPAGGVGNYLVRWTISNDPSPSSFADATITVNAVPTAATNSSGQTIYATRTATLSGNTPVSGIGEWSVVSGPSTSAAQLTNIYEPLTTFTPEGGAGAYLLRWTISTPCSSSAADATIQVNSLETTVTFTGTLATQCADTKTFMLTGGLPSGGSYSGAGVTGNNFDASSAGAGTHTITYSYTNVNGDTNSATNTIVVNAIPVIPTITAGATTTFCAGGSVTLTSSSASGNQWYKNATLISEATGNTYSATSSGDYSVVVTTSGCSSSASVASTVTVNAIPETPTATVTSQPDCSSDTGTITITAPSGAGITYSVDGLTYTNTTGIFNSLVPGSYNVTAKSAGGCISSAIPLTLTAVGNCEPVAVNDAETIYEDGILSGSNLLNNDSDPQGGILTINTTPVNGPSHGTLTINANGTYTYKPDANYNGSDSFVYQVCNDGEPTKCATATVSITIHAVNDSPEGLPKSVTTPEDTPVSGSVTATDPDGDTLTYSKSGNPVNGTVTVSANGTYTYIPAADYNGNDSFKVMVSDGKGGTITVTVFVTITAVNDAPSFIKGANQALCGNSGLQTVINWASSINKGEANESYQTLQFVVTNNNNTIFTDQPAINAAGTLSYTPALNQSGTATVSVQLTDNGSNLNGGISVSTIQTFSIAIYAVPAAPVATAVQSFCGQATLSDLRATAPTGSTLRWYAEGAGGAPLTGSPALTTATSYYAESLSNSNGCSSAARTPVLAIINELPAAPIGNQAQTFCSNIEPKISDLVVAGPNVKWYSSTSAGSEIPQNTLLVNRTTYYASQSINSCESATRLAVTVSLETCIVPPDHYPTLSDISKAMDQNQSLVFVAADFISKFSDVKNDNLVSIRIESLPGRGTLKLSGLSVSIGQEIPSADLGRLEYIPDKAYTGETSFRWSASDGKAYSEIPASVNITISASEIYIPEGFSPNGDGINDYFVIQGAEQYIVTFRVFNRWGNKVYESTHYQNEWDGNSNYGILLTTQLPGGTYFYTVNFNNNQKEIVGSLTLNR